MAATATFAEIVAASEPQDAPPPEAPEIAPEGLLPEIDAPELPETDEPADPYAGLSPQEIAQRVREEVTAAEKAGRDEALRRQRESLLSEQRTNAERAAAEANLRADSEKATEAFRAVALRKVDAWINGDEESSPEEKAALVAELDRGAAFRVLKGVDDAGGVYLRSLGVQQMAPEVHVEYLKAAAQGNTLGMLRSIAETARAVGYYAGMEAAKAGPSASETAETEAAAKLQQTRKANASAAQPTQIRGNGVRAADADAVLASAHPLSPEYARAFKAKHGFDAPKP